MHRIFQKMTPAFLRKIDHHLLTHRPGLWATRLHYLLFYWLIGAGIAGALVWFRPFPLYEIPESKFAIISMLVLAGIALLIWAIQLAHYQPWKQGEHFWRLHALRDQGVYLLGLTLLLALPFGAGLMHQQRIAHLVPYTELKQDQYTFALGQLILENNIEELKARPEALSLYRYMDAPEYFDLSQKETFQAAVRGIRRGSHQDRLEILTNFRQVAAKYAPPAQVYQIDFAEALQLFEQGEVPYRQYNNLRTVINRAENNFREIDHARNSRLTQSDVLAFLSILASFWLLLILFVRTSWQNFLLSVISAVGLIILETMVLALGITAELIPDTQELIVLVLLLNWLGLGGLAFWGSVRNHRQQYLRTIALTLFTVLTAGLPVIARELLAGGSSREIFFTYLLGCVVTLLLWNLFLQPRMLQLVVSPKKR